MGPSGDTAISDWGLSSGRALAKRTFDFSVALVGLGLTFWLIGFTWLLATIDTRSNGFFLQKRVGRNGRLFTVVKLKTMRPDRSQSTTITQSSDARITVLGQIFRKTKLDELPQLWNVLVGDMSFVGPRPDVPGYADRLEGEERLVLSVRPGITGPATLAYRDEEEILANRHDPQRYNDEVIFPDKVRMNVQYIRDWRFRDDLLYIWRTIKGN